MLLGLTASEYMVVQGNLSETTVLGGDSDYRNGAKDSGCHAKPEDVEVH